MIKKVMNASFLVLTSTVFLLTAGAFASDDIHPLYRHILQEESQGIPVPSPAQQNPYFSLFDYFDTTAVSMHIPPAEIFKRTQAVLNYFKVPAEPSYQGTLNAERNLQDLAGATELLPIMDPKHLFDHFATLDASSLKAFQDISAKTVGDFAVSLATTANRNGFFTNFRGSQNKPLQGLRIALDPGHMGGDIWDTRTGKYVTDHRGHKLSEGTINLQVCLLLKQKFEALGATVLVTHETFGPVASKITWENLNLEQFLKEKLLHSTLEGWFQSLLQVAPAGPQLFHAFDQSAPIRRMHQEISRWEYFVLRADLQARAELIKQFQPNLVLIIHFDTSEPHGDPNGVSKTRINATKAYVPGAISSTEIGTREERSDFAAHLLNPYSFAGSLELTRSIVKTLTHDLGTRPDNGSDGTTVLIAPGVQSRNLALNRKIHDTVTSYVECMFYNDPIEFNRLIQPDHQMQIGNVMTTYSNRLVDVADALEKATVDFVTTYR